MKYYFEWFAKQPAAQKDPRCQFYIHNRDSRNEVRATTKLAIRHCGLDMENLPTNEELLKDATKRAEIEKKITSMSSKVQDRQMLNNTPNMQKTMALIKYSATCKT